MIHWDLTADMAEAPGWVGALTNVLGVAGLIVLASAWSVHGPSSNYTYMAMLVACAVSAALCWETAVEVLMLDASAITPIMAAAAVAGAAVLIVEQLGWAVGVEPTWVASLTVASVLSFRLFVAAWCSLWFPWGMREADRTLREAWERGELACIRFVRRLSNAETLWEGTVTLPDRSTEPGRVEVAADAPLLAYPGREICVDRASLRRVADETSASYRDKGGRLHVTIDGIEAIRGFAVPGEDVDPLTQYGTPLLFATAVVLGVPAAALGFARLLAS